MVRAVVDSFVLEENTVSLDAELECFIRSQAFTSSIKLTTGKYLLANSALAARDGIKPEDYKGLTPYDIKEITHRKPEVTEQAVYMDQQIFSAKLPLACYQQILLTHDQSVLIEEVIKKPIFDKNKQIVGLLAHGNDLTRHAHPMWLFKLYESYYTTQEAVRYFLQYKKIENAFEVLPSREELLTLLAMRDTKDVMGISKQLKYTKREVENYQAKLREKLKVIGINDCLMYLNYVNENTGQDAIGWD